MKEELTLGIKFFSCPARCQNIIQVTNETDPQLLHSRSKGNGSRMVW
jgi:hypothetical protein